MAIVGVFYFNKITPMLDQGYGIMPNSILFNKELSDKEKLLYCLISSLCAAEWYSWATNQYFSEKLWTHKDNIRKYISKMNKSWIIFLEEINNTRYISICKMGEFTQGGGWIYPGGVGEFTHPIYRMNSIIEKDNVIQSEISENSETSRIEEKPKKRKSKNEGSSSIRKRTLQEPFVPPDIETFYNILWKTKWSNKFHEFFSIWKIYQSFTEEQIKETYDWMIWFFQEKFEWKIYRDDNTNKMVWSDIILDELDKMIAYYSSKWRDIVDLKATMRTWIVKSAKPYPFTDK